MVAYGKLCPIVYSYLHQKGLIVRQNTAVGTESVTFYSNISMTQPTPS